ncbi:MAG: hypothetical protein M3498_18720 [Deinococcota bacterium]|jgi:hypothetical protein|nr:hypothetical protein [Deinococcota bacterium]
MNKVWVLLVFLLVFLLGLALAQEAYFPAREGLSWTYSNGETQAFGATEVFDGYEVLVFTHSFGGNPVSEDYLSYTAEAVRLHGTAAGGELVSFDPPLVIYPGGELEVGQTWQSRALVGGFEISLLAEVLGMRGVETPAGRFDALQIRQWTVTSTGAQTLLDLYFVPSVGVVRSVLQDGSVVDLVDKNF